MTRRGVFLVAALLSATSLSCGGDKPPAATAKPAEAPLSWADVFDGTPNVYGVIRPKAIKSDGVYGAFFKALVRLAQAKTRARGDTMVQALEGVDEIVVGIDGSDAAVVLRGVPANLDPEKITDTNGRALFLPITDRTRVVEYDVLDRSVSGGGLFVLPDRVWVGTLGETRARARQAFRTPAHRPVPKLDREALAAVRVAGPLLDLVKQDVVFGPLGKKLVAVTGALKPGKGGLVVGFAYPDSDAAAWAEMEAKRILGELAKDEKRAWLRDAKVQYEESTVFVRVAVPPRILEEIPRATGADLPL